MNKSIPSLLKYFWQHSKVLEELCYQCDILYPHSSFGISLPQLVTLFPPCTSNTTTTNERTVSFYISKELSSKSDLVYISSVFNKVK